MDISVRSYLTAGVALAGAGIIAVTPVTPAGPALRDIQAPAFHTADVQLASLLNPLDVFAPIFEQATANSQVIGQKILQDPFPILQALALNQLDSGATLLGLGTDVAQTLADIALAVPGNLQTAIGLLQAGDIDRALQVIENGIIGPWFPLVMKDLPQLVNVLKKPLVDAQVLIENLPMSYLAGIGFPVLNSFYALQTQIINGVSGVAEALSTGNPENIANAITTGAANFTQELLNGNPATNTHGLLGIYGPINGFLDAGITLAYFLRPPVDPFGLTAEPKAAVSTVTLANPPAVKAAIPKAAISATQVATEAAATGITEGSQSVKETAPTEEAQGTSTTTTGGTEATGAATTDGTQDSEGSDQSAAEAVNATRVTGPNNGNKVAPGQARRNSISADSGLGHYSNGVRDGITKTVKDVADGLKKAAKKVTGRTDASGASTGSKASESSGTSRATGGKHRASA